MKKKILIISLCLFIGLAASFRLFCGIFVIQPLGALPDGTTIVYWRSGLNMPFIASADGLLDQSDAGVSLLGRGMLLAGLSEPITNREMFRLGYSDTLYLWSTGGHRYEEREPLNSTPVTFQSVAGSLGESEPSEDFPIDLP
jgi:hypothetical protein